MLHILNSSIFESPAQTLVNTVNTVGVMGKGVAKGFKERYPLMFREYKNLCDQHVLKIGTLHCWHGPSRWILNFPTKTTWKKPSKLEYIEAGLDAFVCNYKRMGIQSISFPPLGCGNGQLEWSEVRPMMLRYLWNLEIPIFLHEWFASDAKAEQYEPAARAAPISYKEFLNDLHALIDEKNGRFLYLLTNAPFQVQFGANNNLEVYDQRKSIVQEDFIATAWAGLQVGLLTSHTLGSEVESSANHLLPVIAALPYVNVVEVQLDTKSQQVSAGLFLNEQRNGFDKYRVGDSDEAQRCLSL